MTLEAYPVLTPPFYGAAPPPTPVEGSEWIYPADASQGVLWRFRYRAGQTLPWEFIGGSELMTEVAGDDAIASPQTTFQPGATLCQLPVPRTGDYQVAHGATMYANGAATLYFTVGTAAAGWSDNESVQIYMASTLTAVTGARILRRSYTAGDVVQQRYRNVTAAATDALRRWLNLRPVRVS